MNDRTFLAAPGYGSQSAASGRALWRASRDMSVVQVEQFSASLLAANFNGLWCHALNQGINGDTPAYFAMLHDDVAPEEYWLDVLIEELEDKKLDVLGTVVPIKDQRGLTSTALDGADTWSPKQRLTIKEVASLPETFTSEDVGAPLLINTGCWVCRFSPAWVSKVHFTINDRIVQDKATGRYLAQCEPEDWYFSRLCHELQLRIGATRKVALAHRGEMDFRSDAVWGQPFDTEYGSRSVVADHFPFDVPGWLHPDEGLALAGLCESKRVLEIGSYLGKSTICIARTAAHVVCLDHFDGRGTPNPQPTWDGFWANLKRYDVDQKVYAYKPSHPLPSDSFDAAFIDGQHDKESVQVDIAKALDALKPGGLLVFHDYSETQGQNPSCWHPGVTDAVNDLLNDGGELVSRQKTLAVVRPPVPVSV